MLAGVLLNLCLAPVRGVAQLPGPALAIVAAWVVAGRVHRLLGVPAALVVTILLIMLRPGPAPAASALPFPVLVWPTFTFAALIGVAVPLFIVTMASQNIPGNRGAEREWLPSGARAVVPRPRASSQCWRRRLAGMR